MAQSLSVTCAMQDVNTVLIHPGAPQQALHNEFFAAGGTAQSSPALSDQLDSRPK
jgi:hypothetical protein